MEVITALGAAASIATVVELSGSCINKLMDLRAKYKISDLNVQVSVAQLSTLKAALTQISAWTCEDPEVIPDCLETDLGLSLGSCRILVDGLNNHLSQIRTDGIATLSFSRKAKFLLNGREWDHLQTLLSHQISAIQLFLTTMQCRTQVEQEALLRRPENHEIICSVRDDSSSLLWLRDDDSCGTRKSTCTETSDFLDASFAFDPEIFKSRAYLSAMRSNIRGAVRGSNQRFRRNRTAAKTNSSAAAPDRDREGSSQVSSGPERHDSSTSNSISPEGGAGQWSNPHSVRSSLCQFYETTQWDNSSRHQVNLAESDFEHGFGPTMTAQKVEDPVRHKALHIPSRLRSRDLIASPSRASIKAAFTPRKLDGSRDETQLLLVGHSKEMAILLQRSMKLAYGQNYSKADRMEYRISILRDVVFKMRNLLLFMVDLGISLTEPSSVSYAQYIMDDSAKGECDFIPPAASTAIAVLWKDPAVIDAYHRQDAGHKLDDFFNAIERISHPSYDPSLEDLSRASMKTHDVESLIVPKKSAGRRFQYRIIDTVASDAGGSKWIYTSDTVSLVVHIVDLATYDVTHDDDQSTNELKQDLIFFQKLCSSSWLVETPVLVLLGGAVGLPKKLHRPPIQNHFPEFAGQDSNVADAKAYFRNLFLQADKRYKMRVWVDFIDKDASAAIGKLIVGTIDRILTEESILSNGLR
ncbi:MAG: hypothetical protein Q9177_003342 [Variospora cf. flavescens]